MDAFIHKVTDVLTHKEASKVAKISGTVVIVKSNVVGFNDFVDSFLDGLHELVGSGITFQLISATVGDPKNGNKGKLGKPAQLERWITTGTFLAAGDSGFKLTFEWDEQLGVPGAVIVKNSHHGEFFLKSFTLDGVLGKKSRIHFDCNSWVYPYSTYNYDRVFFANDTFLPGNTPEPLKAYRAAELANLRGDGVAPRELKEGDRIYAYDVYNDLGDPDSGEELVRPILGGSKEYPYPRRARTGRKMTKTDPKSETRLPLLFSLNVYVPRDERFGHLKMSDFLGYSLKALAQGLVPVLNEAADLTPFEFDTFQDVLNLYEGGIDLPDSPALENVRKQIPFALIKELFRSDGENLFRLPTPAVIKADKFAWRTDEEFGREMLAGVNPVCIRLLTKFPPVSSLDPNTYGDHNSTMTADQLEKNMNGLSVEEALNKKKLFILDHHDSLMPYLERINTFNKIYASRTVLLLQDDGTLKPLAIELSLPIKGQKGAVSKVYTPAEHGVEAAVWQLAKAFAAVNDSGIHQLISHWLNTHATIEPFAIALNRQLSVVHPIYKLLHPHFRDTMNINAFARQILINAGGILEMTVFPGKYALEMSSVVYKGWKLTDHALPVDLLNRGVAENDPSAPGKLRLLIEDYPYAVDGLAVWSAIEIWVKEYCAIYYPSDKILQEDTELQAWWKEVREVGHGDKKDETWWPTMKTVAELTQTCCTIIWVASALHAAVNFGQYPYAGYLPNRPTVSRRFMPEPGTPEYEELKTDPDRAFLKTITSQLQTTIGVSLIEILSRHSSDEVYLGQRISAEWTTDQKALAAFKAFGERLITIENQIIEMNHEPKLKNRNGPVKLPYTLLYPNTSDYTRVGGLTGRGIPNSVSI